MRYLLAIALLTSLSYGQEAVLFDEVASHFSKATAPQITDLKGYTAGRCVGSETPNTLLPAVFLTKKLNDDSVFPPVRLSFSYYSENGKVDFFDNFTTTQINQLPRIAKWMQQETWPKIQEKNGSLVTHVTLPDTTRLVRAIRVFEGRNSRYLLMKVARQNQNEEVALRYCYFHRPLKDTLSPTEPSEIEEVFLGQTQGMSQLYFSLKNPAPKLPFEKIRIENHGAAVFLQEVQIFLSSGLYTEPITIELPANSSRAIKVSGSASFEFDRVRFFVSGPSENIKVFALKQN